MQARIRFTASPIRREYGHAAASPQALSRVCLNFGRPVIQTQVSNVCLKRQGVELRYSSFTVFMVAAQFSTRIARWRKQQRSLA
jgi:hypothetical protein